MEDGNLTPMESKILAAIDDGTLTKEKLEKGVCALIKMELEQNEHPANMELVSACESLLEKPLFSGDILYRLWQASENLRGECRIAIIRLNYQLETRAFRLIRVYVR